MSRQTGRARNDFLRERMDVVAHDTVRTRNMSRKTMYMKIIKMLAISRFTWTGLPAGMDERFIELTLFERGSCLFFPDERLGRFLVAQMNYAGNVNLWYNPTTFTPVGNNYTHAPMDSKHAVPIWDNFLRVTMYDVLEMYANRLAMMDRALDVNIDNINIPLILSCNETQKLTVENLLRNREEGMPVILTYSDLDLSELVKIFPNNTPYLADKILHEKANIWNECVRYLGIESGGAEKKERLITDEAKNQESSTNVFRLNYLKSRQQACDIINGLWPDLTVGVKWSDITTGGIMEPPEEAFNPVSLTQPFQANIPESAQ